MLRATIARSFIAVLVLAPSWLGCHELAPRARSLPATPTWTGPLPEAERLAQDVAWLADDAREGRRAGTRGEQAAAEWIAARLAELHLEPAGASGWSQEFEVPLPARDGGKSFLVWQRGSGTVATERAGADARIAPLFCSAAGEAKGPVVFAGFGIVQPELGWDDFAGLDLAGSIALVVRGTPGEAALAAAARASGVAQEEASWANGGAIFQKVMEAKRRGARAVLLAQHPSEQGQELLRFDAGQTARAGIPALMLSAELAAALVPSLAERLAHSERGERAAAEAAGADAPDRAAVSAHVSADVVRSTAIAHNVLGRLRGRRADCTVIVGAHFDHLGRGGEGSLARDALGEIHNGADDNASGTAAALEIARCLSQGEPPEGDVLIALWSGEELGLLGSEFWAQHPTLALEGVRANLNLDMVGRAGAGSLQVLGAGTAAEFAAILAEANLSAGLKLGVNASGQGIGGSDHQTFLKRKIPALHFFTGVHADYHKPSDDAAKFEAGGARDVALLALETIRRIQAAPRLAYTEPTADPEAAQTAPRGGFRTRFGSVPDYAFEGPGLRLAGTSADSPAERAGLLQGDVLVAVDDIAIETIYDFMYALNAHKPGDVVRVRFVRDGAEESVRVTLDSPDLE
jgi:hypothetical protein